MFQWNPEGAQRLVQLESGAATASTTSAPTTSRAIESNPDLQLVPRDPLNVVLRRLQRRHGAVQRPGACARRSRSASTASGSSTTSIRPARMAATQFLPPGIPGYEEGFVDFEYDPEAAAAMIAEAYPDGLEVDAQLPRRRPGRTCRSRRRSPPTSRPSSPTSASTSPSTCRSRRRSSTTSTPARCRSTCSGGAPTSRIRRTSSTTTSARRQVQFGTGFPDILDAIAEAGSEHRPGRPPRPLPAGQPAARRAHPDGADRLRRLGDGLQGGRAGRPRQPADQRDPGGDGARGPGPVRVRPERRAGRPVLRGRDRRRDAAGLRADHRVAARLRDRRHRSRSRRSPRAGSPTRTSRCGRSTSARA